MSETRLNHGERILIALDGSETSHWAAQVGNHYAAQLDAQIRLIHVIEPTIPVYEEFAAAQEIEECRQRYGHTLLSQARQLIAKGLKVETALRRGHPAEEIVAEATTWGATLLVVGSRGRGRLAEFLRGSTVEDLHRCAPCPVVVVAHQPHFGSDADQLAAAKTLNPAITTLQRPGKQE